MAWQGAASAVSKGTDGRSGWHPIPIRSTLFVSSLNRPTATQSGVGRMMMEGARDRKQSTNGASEGNNGDSRESGTRE